MELKLDHYVSKFIEHKSGGKNVKVPDVPLSDEEKKLITEEIWVDCVKYYKFMVVKLSCESDFETSDDLDGYAFIFMNEILNVFDKAPYKALDEKERKGKTILAFHFFGYFKMRVYWKMLRLIDSKKKRGLPSHASPNVVYEYDGAAEDNQDDKINLILDYLSEDLYAKKMFVMKHMLGYNIADLKFEFAERYDKTTKYLETCLHEIHNRGIL